LSTANPLAVCTAVAEDNILASIMPQPPDISALKNLCAREAMVGTQRWTVRLAAWLGDGADFTLSRRESDVLRAYNEVKWQNPRAAMYRGKRDDVLGAIILHAPDDAWQGLYQTAAEFLPPEFPLTAADVMALGVEPGLQLGKILRQTEKWWIAGGFVADVAACRDYATKLSTVSNA
jgi:hypothetical protein